MEKKTVKTKKQKTVDPFAELAETAESIPAPKRAVKVIKKATASTMEMKAPVKKPAKLVAKKTPKTVSDAFAEIATLSSTTEPASPNKVTAKAKAAVRPAKKRTIKVVSSDSVPSLEKPKRVRKITVKAKPDTATPVIAPSVLTTEVEVSPVFRALADVTLPELKREDRARLMLQSPTKLFFYWSVKQNPYQLLRNAFGEDIGSYTLVLKLTDLTGDTEEIYPAEPEGNWWFTVEPDREYRAEIGFYATSRPYFRIIYSNTIETPRRSPSPHPASEARWTVSANKFAEVLDVSGFKRDAIDVAIAGDEPQAADASHNAFAHLIGRRENLTKGIPDGEVHQALVSIASGSTVEDLRFKVSAKLFEILQSNADRLTASNAQISLTEYFELDEESITGQAVFGSSLIHFPRSPKKARALRPVSS